jgi:hypothetical protein
MPSHTSRRPPLSHLQRLLPVVRAQADADVGDEEVVLVVLADETDVGLPEDLDVDRGGAV